jgi:hypothetical protein
MGGYGSGRKGFRTRAESLVWMDLEGATELGYPTVARPSNLGAGEVRYLFCKGCTGAARVLYLVGPGRWRCRHCHPVTYRSSRSSDARVSAILRDPSALASYATPAPFDPASPPGAAAMAAQIRLSTAGLLVLLKLAERLESNHAGQGKRWSAKRWAAQANR